MGYSDGTKGYWLYNLEKKMLIIIKDIIFDKNVQESQSTPTIISLGQPIIPVSEDQVRTQSSTSSPGASPSLIVAVVKTVSHIRFSSEMGKKTSKNLWIL